MSEEQLDQSPGAEAPFDPARTSKALVAEIQARKAPLEKQRAEVYAQIKDLKAKFENDLAPLREKLHALNNEHIVPLDKLLRNADGLKNLRGPLAEKVAGEILGAMEELD